jgi:hypothetical protein
VTCTSSPFSKMQDYYTEIYAMMEEFFNTITDEDDQ